MKAGWDREKEMDGESVGDDEAEAAKLSWLPSLVCEKAACEHECVCVFKVEHWARNVNKCHVIFAEALCRDKQVFSVPFHNNSRRAAFSLRCIIFRRCVRVKHFRRSTHHTSVNGFNTATEMIHWETLCGVNAYLNLVFFLTIPRSC